MQPDFFPNGEDLPLFAETPIRVREQVCKPAPLSQQPALFDLRPQFGGQQEPVKPSPELSEVTQ